MEEINLDAIDLRLLAQLQTDASLSNQALAERLHLSPPTCLRRVKRLHEAGLIERQVALLSPDRLAALQGHGLTALVEVSLDRQDADSLDAFEARIVQDDLALSQRLFSSDANVRNTKAFFSVKRAKFAPKVLLATV